jgi:putative nucleotidyltransferase with HDIG domain
VLSADCTERPSEDFIGKRLNKNIYNNRQVLLWPEYTVMTERMAEQAFTYGIELSMSDFETDQQTLIRVADVSYEELNGFFGEARNNKVILVEGIRENIVPMLKETISAGSLIPFLLHLHTKDDATCRHSIAVGAISVMMGRWLNRPEEELNELLTAALLHDIGKLRVPEYILNKPGKLTPDEFVEMQKHTLLGYEMLRQTNDISERSAVTALQHHERVDGSGYPYGITGEHHEPFSRIVAIADVFHAMSSKRVYKEKLQFHHVIREMHQETFGRFDASIALVFITKMMEILIGAEVTLTNGERAVVISLNPADPINPLVQASGMFIDLSKNPELNISYY